VLPNRAGASSPRKVTWIRFRDRYTDQEFYVLNTHFEAFDAIAREKSARLVLERGTFHAYRPLTPDGDRIDWILTSPAVTTLRASTNTFHSGGQFPSDHLPVRATVRLP
jgi:endonuclease/exonuclease/phosphatase family metal-dependent hydrolase